MFCKNCGANVTEGLSFCPNCGSPVQPAPQATYQQPTYQQPVQPTPQPTPQPQVNYQQANPQPTYQQAAAAPIQPSTVLTMGIVGLAIGGLGVPGIIVSAIARNKAKTYLESGAPYSTKVKVGNGLALGGLIYSIVMTVIWVIYVIAICAMAMSY